MNVVVNALLSNVLIQDKIQESLFYEWPPYRQQKKYTLDMHAALHIRGSLRALVQLCNDRVCPW